MKEPERKKMGRPPTRVGCYSGCGKLAQPGRRFCTNRCGREWAEREATGIGDSWDHERKEWR